MPDTGYARNAAELPPGDQPTDATVGASDREEFSDAWLLAKARTLYTSSTDYLTTNVTKQWERSLAHFRGEHAPGARYHSKDFKRSRTFRPKTRANIKAQEASLANAAFSTQEIVDVKPVDATSAEQAVGAAITKAIMQHRLEQPESVWFLTVVGAYQDTKNYGICISHQYWDYQATRDLEPAVGEDGKPVTETDPETGEETPMGREKVTVLVDRPRCDIVEPENFRFDPMCDWRNPAATSPYLIYLRPMYAADALEEMKREDVQGRAKPWRKYTLAEVLSTRRQSVDRVRQAREGRGRTDPAEEQAGNELTIVWAHLNILRVRGIDYAWWTMGTELVLTEPVPLNDPSMYPHLRAGERPFVVGCSTVEAHRNYPAGDAEQAAPLQEEINDVANQRLDNVKLVLNKRYLVRRGSQTDLDALMRNVPGGGVMVNDTEKDINVVNTPDVTSSSYQEQDRLATDFDDLVGGFSQNSVTQNRKLSDTARGLERVASTAGAVQDYGVKVFFETWLEPVLRQMQRLIAFYETDDKVLVLAARQSGMYQRFGIDRATDDLLMQDLVVRINVGMGNTDPMQRTDRLVNAVGNVNALPGMIERLKSGQVADEIFGAAGFKDASRFYKTDEEMERDPPPAPPVPPEIQLKKEELEIRREDNQARDRRETADLELKKEIEYARLALQEKLTLEEMYVKLGVEKAKNKTVRDVTAVKEANRIAELNLKQTTGEGI